MKKFLLMTAVFLCTACVADSQDIHLPVNARPKPEPRVLSADTTHLRIAFADITAIRSQLTGYGEVKKQFSEYLSQEKQKLEQQLQLLSDSLKRGTTSESIFKQRTQELNKKYAGNIKIIESLHWEKVRAVDQKIQIAINEVRREKKIDRVLFLPGKKHGEMQDITNTIIQKLK